MDIFAQKCNKLVAEISLTQGVKKSETNTYGGARDVMVIVVGNGHGDTSSNP